MRARASSYWRYRLKWPRAILCAAVYHANCVTMTQSPPVSLRSDGPSDPVPSQVERPASVWRRPSLIGSRRRRGYTASSAQYMCEQPVWHEPRLTDELMIQYRVLAANRSISTNDHLPILSPLHSAPVEWRSHHIWLRVQGSEHV